MSKCVKKKLKCASWIFYLNPDISPSSVKTAFSNACKGGHLHVITWLAKNEDIMKLMTQ